MSSARTEELILCAWILTFDDWKDDPEFVWYVKLFESYISISTPSMPVFVVLCLLSAFVSSVNVFVLTRGNMRQAPLNVLLAALEFITVIFNVSYGIYLLKHLFFGLGSPSISALIIEALVRFTFYGSLCFTNWMTVIVAVWRLVGLKRPLNSRNYLSRKRAVVIIKILGLNTILLLVLLYSSYRIETSDKKICTDLVSKNLTVYKDFYLVQIDWITNNFHIKHVFIHITTFIYFGLPAVCFPIATVCLLATLKKLREPQNNLREGQVQGQSKREQTRTTIVLIILLGFHVAINSVQALILTLVTTEKYKYDLKLRSFTIVTQGYYLFSFVNLFSFVAYYFMGSNFRNTFLELLCQRNTMTQTTRALQHSQV